MPTRDAPWTAFKMKIMLHFGSAAMYPYLDTLAPLDNTKSARSRIASYNKVVAELEADGLIYQNAAAGEYIYATTPKGRCFVEGVLSTPLPVATEPKWYMPNSRNSG